MCFESRVEVRLRWIIISVADGCCHIDAMVRHIPNIGTDIRISLLGSLLGAALFTLVPAALCLVTPLGSRPPFRLFFLIIYECDLLRHCVVAW